MPCFPQNSSCLFQFTPNSHQPSYFEQPEQQTNLLCVTRCRDGPAKRCMIHKKVRFMKSPVSQVRRVQRNEGKKCWYTLEELAFLKNERRAFVWAMRRTTGVQEGESGTALLSDRCVRGMEDYRTRESTIAKKTNIKFAINAVLVEQKRQRFMGTCDANVLRLASVQATFSSQCYALRLGLFDAKEALTIYNDLSAFQKLDKK